MPRNSIIIRNITTISFQEIGTIMMQLTENLSPKLIELKQLVQISEPQSSDIQNAYQLITDPEVRDFVYEAILNQTGSYIILHQDGIDMYGKEVREAFDYISQKLHEIPQNKNFDLIYLGGGHGDPLRGTNSLSPPQVKIICQALQQKGINAMAIVLGSCFSAAYFSHFQQLLNDNGIMLGNSLESGGENQFIQSFNWTMEDRDRFYSVEDITRAVKTSTDSRSDLRRVMEGRINGHDKLYTEYNNLLEHYEAIAHLKLANEQLNDGALLNKVYELKGDLFNKDLSNILIDMQSFLPNISDENLEEILTKYPLIKQHINEISTKRELSNIYNAIRNILKPAPTSLVIATKGTINMLDVRQPGNKPPNASEQYQNDFDIVLHSNLSSFNINFNSLDAVSIRETFNEKLRPLSQAQKINQKENPAVNTSKISIFNGYSKLSLPFKAFLSDTTQEIRHNLGHMSTEDYWLMLDLQEQQDLQNSFLKAQGASETQQKIELPLSSLRLSPFILKDSEGDNYVTGVEEHNGGYRIIGANNKGEPRYIFIDKDGNATSFHGSKNLGTVGSQMYANREKILEYFVGKESKNNTTPVCIVM